RRDVRGPRDADRLDRTDPRARAAAPAPRPAARPRGDGVKAGRNPAATPARHLFLMQTNPIDQRTAMHLLFITNCDPPGCRGRVTRRRARWSWDAGTAACVGPQCDGPPCRNLPALLR